MRQSGEAVMQSLRGRAHVQGVGADELLGEETRVRIGACTHRVATHVLDAAGDPDVVRAEGDRTGDRRDARHRARAHAVDRVARHAERQSGQDGGGAPQGEPLIAGLGGRRDGDVVDALLRQLRVALEQPDHRLDDEVVGPGVPVLALLTGASERSPHSIDEDDFGSFSHGSEPLCAPVPARHTRSGDGNRRLHLRPQAIGETLPSA